MIEEARIRNPDIEFRAADMRSLPVSSGTFAGVVALYSLIHFAGDDLDRVLGEIRACCSRTASCSPASTAPAARPWPGAGC